MPLYQDGSPATAPDLSGEIAPAKDQSGKQVVVSASSEAVQDFGWSLIWTAASAKYDREGGDSVRIGTADLQG